MLCNRCGTKNEDQARFCRSCGHKLRSRADDSSEAPQPEKPGVEKTALFDTRGRGRAKGIGKYAEGFVYALLLLGGVGYGLWSGNYVPMYVLALIVAVVAGLRRI